MTIEERALQTYPVKMSEYTNGEEYDFNESDRLTYIEGATDQYKIDIDVIPQLYVRWLMLEMDNKPTWIDYINQINGIQDGKC